jgi:hypothetical protein
VSEKPKLNKNYIKTTEIYIKSTCSSMVTKPTCEEAADDTSSAPRMTAPPVSSSGDGGLEKRRPNSTLSTASHREQIKNEDTKKRLNKLNFFNITSDINNGTYPTPGELVKNNGFGKPFKTQSFTTEAHFDQIVLQLLKSGFLNASQINLVARTSELYAHLIRTMVRCVDINFHPLAQYNTDYATQ